MYPAYPGLTVYTVSNDIATVRVDTVQISTSSVCCVIVIDVSNFPGDAYYRAQFSATLPLTASDCDEWVDKAVGTTALYAEDGTAMCYRLQDAEEMLATRMETAKLWNQLKALVEEGPTILPAAGLEKLSRAVELVKGVKR